MTGKAEKQIGFDEQNLPIGLQLIGNVLREDLLFRVGYAYEQSTEWHTQKPPLV